MNFLLRTAFATSFDFSMLYLHFYFVQGIFLFLLWFLCWPICCFIVYLSSYICDFFCFLLVTELFHIIMFRKHAWYDYSFNLLNLVFVTQHMIYFGKCPMWFRGTVHWYKWRCWCSLILYCCQFLGLGVITSALYI